MGKSKQIRDLGFRTFKTLTERDEYAGLVFVEMRGVVYNDGTPSNNGTYHVQSVGPTVWATDDEGNIASESFTAQVTAIDADLLSTDTVSNVAKGAVSVYINGVLTDSDYDGATINDCVFVDSGNTILRQTGEVITGDLLRWYGSNAGYEISATDDIKIHYLENKL